MNSNNIKLNSNNKMPPAPWNTLKQTAQARDTTSQISTNEERLIKNKKKFFYTEPKKVEGCLDSMSMNENMFQWSLWKYK